MFKNMPYQRMIRHDGKRAEDSFVNYLAHQRELAEHNHDRIHAKLGLERKERRGSSKERSIALNASRSEERID